MEVVQGNATLLSNYEVFSQLKEFESTKYSKSTKYDSAVSTIAYSTLRYLEETPCCVQTPDFITTFLDAITRFRLTLAEQLTLVNIRPQSAVELQLIIEETEERFSEQEIEDLIEIIGKYLPNNKEEEEEEEAEGEGVAEQDAE